MAHHLLFLCMPNYGHLLPNLAVVEELKRRGHRVTFVTGESLAEIVRTSGADVVTYPSLHDKHAPGERKWTQEGENNPVHTLEDSALMLREAKAKLDDDRPDVVLYDFAAFQTGRILAGRWGVPAIQLNPMFAVNEHWSLAHAIHPAEQDEAKAEEQVKQEEAPAQGLPPGLEAFLAKLGELLADNGVQASPWEFLSAIEKFSLVYVPRAFQFAGETFDERFAFVGPCLSDRSFWGEWRKPDTDRPILLVSLGTIFNELADFWRACVRAFADEPWHVVMTVGQNIDPAELEPLPPNVEVHRFVPHLDVLRHAQAFVNHGGTGSVMESLICGVPMVVVPTSTDGRPVTVRVEQLDLGREVLLDDVTPERLRDAVREVVGNDTIRKNVQEMRQLIEDAGGAPRAADEIEAYVARSTA